MKNVIKKIAKTSLLLMSTVVTTHVTVVKAAQNDIEFLNPKQSTVSLPFSEAVRVGPTLYLSGQIGLKKGEMKLAEGGIQAETKQTLENINATLKSYGYSKGDVVKCSIMLADIADFKKFNDVYRNFFVKPYPARSTFAVSGLAFNAKIEIECIAAK